MTPHRPDTPQHDSVYCSAANAAKLMGLADDTLKRGGPPGAEWKAHAEGLRELARTIAIVSIAVSLEHIAAHFSESMFRAGDFPNTDN